MIIFLCVLAVAGIFLEVYACTDGLKHVTFDYSPSVFSAEPGEMFSVITTVTNTGFVPISYIKADINYPKAIILPDGTEYFEKRFNTAVSDIFRLWGKQRKERRLNVSITKRGVHTFNGASLSRGDFIGVKEISADYEGDRVILIFPSRLNNSSLNEAIGNFYGDIIAERCLLQDPILTSGIREYTGCEPMKNISWTQSARRGELMVREFDYTKELSCSVILCTNGIGPLDSAVLDKCCSITRTVCENLTERGVIIDFYTNAPLTGYRSENVQMCTVSSTNNSTMLEILARVYAASRTTSEELAGFVTRTSDKRSAFIMIVSEETEEITAAAKELYNFSGAKTIVIAASEYSDD